MSLLRSTWFALVLLCGACKRPAAEAKPPPHAIDAVFDGIESNDPKIAPGAVKELATLLNSGTLTPAIVEPRTARVLAPLRVGLAKALPLQHHEPGTCGSWIHEPSYEPIRLPLELFIDLAGMARASEAAPELEKGLKLSDPQLRWFAVRSLWRLGRNVDAATLAALAREDTVRNRMFEELSARDSVELMPANERTQEALARANLVEWLVYPTELGCEPNDIELVKLVSVGNDDHYVFRFRTDEAKLGQPAQTWILGAAGPYRRGHVTAHGSGTFSTFARADAKTAEQYVADMRAVIDSAKKNIDPKTLTAPILPGK